MLIEPWCIKKSDVHGEGLFATRDINVGERVAHSADLESNKIHMYVWELSEAGRHTNHRTIPNTIVNSDGNKMTMVAINPIKMGEEIFVNYFQAASIMFEGRQFTYKGKLMPIISPKDLQSR